MKILLVEDDPLTAAILSEAITAQHYTVDVATDGEMGWQFATSWEYDLILLDLLIPKLDGISLCRKLRGDGHQTPILLLTAKDASADVVEGLDAGADDYVTKPYDLSALLARMRALLRRGQISLAPTFFTWEHLCVNPVSAEVTYQGQLLSLSPKEYGLLGLFLRHPQRVFSRSDIIDRLWSIDASPSEGAVTNLIKDLRQKLKVAGMKIDLLETVYGLGYRLKTPPEQFTVVSGEANHSRKVKNSSDINSSDINSNDTNSNDTNSNDTNSSDINQLETTLQGASNGKVKSKLNEQKDLTSISKVLERYQNTFVERVAALGQIESVLQTGTLNLVEQQNAAQEAHRLTGALGSFGYEVGSGLARSIEHLLMGDQPLTETQVSQFSRWVNQLKQELAKPPIPLSDRFPKATQVPVVLVIDQDAAFTERLKQDAFAWGFQVEVIPDATIAQHSFRQKLRQEPPQAVLLSLQDPLEAGFVLVETLVETLADQFPTIPVLVVTGQDRLADRVTVSRLGIKRFLHKPIATADVFKTIGQILPKSQPATARVMVLDDDRLMLDTVVELLQPWGLQVTTLQDPEQFWTVLTATQPDLLLLDIEMPTFNGIDLCRVVRQDAQWGNLPILVITAHTHRALIHQVFAAGADDFISKPVVGPELVTRVISRIDRSRLQQDLETMKRRIGT